jgi:tetratricopeptide (TPR) repeat protein
MRRFATLTLVLFAGTLAFAQAPIAPPKPAKKISKKEAEAYNAMVQAQDSDSRIKLANDLITNFADTQFKGLALFMEADAYLRKGDNDKAIVFAEQAIEADPKNYQALVLLAKTYAATTHINDLDKQEKLTKADKYANDALEILKTVDKPNPKMTDAEWTSAKGDFEGQCYMALGISAAFRNKVDDATANFQKVSELDLEPADLIRCARALIDTHKPEQAIVWLDKAIASPNASPQIKTIATNDKARAQSMIKK